MNSNSRFVQTFTFDEIGTLAVIVLERLHTKSTKRERKSAFSNVQSFLPKPQPFTNHKYILESLSIGCDKNGDQVVVASYAITNEEPKHDSA